MGRIQSSIGLITGVPIADTVDQLMALSARPRDLLQARTADLKQQQVAIGELTALTISLQLSATQLKNEALYSQRTVSSSNESLLSASVTGDPAPGSYAFTPLRQSQTHQLISDGVAGLDQVLGAGDVKLGFGGFVDRGIDLELLNQGAGVQRGKIRITDRSGASQVVDLSSVLTVDEVLSAINQSDLINVRAEAKGDAIRVVDQTGQAVSNLIVQEVNGGTTASDLGLGGVDVASSSATGQDVLSLYANQLVDTLNDGSGISIRDELPDLKISFRDGSADLEIDLTTSAISTLGDLLDALNAADPTRLSAGISADGDHLELTDLTVDSGGTFAVTSPYSGTLAEDLGLTVAASGAVLTGGRLQGGLRTPLLSSLQGGAGIGSLGQISLTDRSGTSDTVDLSAAVSLEDVVDALNGASVAISAGVNAARDGITIVDTSGATASNLIVANADATNSADALNLAVDQAVTSVDSGSLGLQVLHEGVTLDSLNFGEGVDQSSFLITDSAGAAGAVNLVTAGITTIGQLVEEINGLGIGVEARINTTGDGLLLVDTAGGAGTLEVEESGSGSSAADLGILGSATIVTLNGSPTQVIDGAASSTIQVDAADTLQDLVDKINAADAGVQASILNTGSGSAPYRLVLTSLSAGKAGEIRFDTSQFGLDFHEIVSAQDAALLVGAGSVAGAGVIATSTSNQFGEVLDGVQLTVNGPSETPVTVNVSSTDDNLISAVTTLVNQYNAIRDKLDELTFYNETDNSSGILFGSNEALRVETTLTNQITDRLFSVGEFQSLEELGISLDDTGQLSVDETKLGEQIAANAADVEKFFTDADFGFAKRLEDAVNSLAGEGDSLLLSRNAALQSKIEDNIDRIAFFNIRLDAERGRLLSHFYAMESAVAKIQSNLTYLQSIAALPPLTSSSKN